MVLFETTNPSNHNGIQLTITCFDNAIYSQTNRLQSDRKPKIAWHKATDANYKAYKSNLDQQLIAIEQNIDLHYCYDYNCKCNDHRIAIDDLCKSLIECCLKASTITIPQTTFGITKEIPGWNDLAKQEREQSLFWHWIWCECGKPYNGDIYNIMKKTRHTLLNPPSSMENNAVSTGDKSCIATQ